MINYQLFNDLTPEAVQSCIQDVYENAGFETPDEFIKFYHEHFDDECEWEYFDDTMNEAYQFETECGGRPFALWYWDDYVWERIEGNFDDYSDDIIKAYVNEMVKEVNENYSEKL